MFGFYLPLLSSLFGPWHPSARVMLSLAVNIKLIIAAVCQVRREKRLFLRGT